MKYWFAIRVYDPSVDIHPGAPVLHGPFDTYQDATVERNKYIGLGADIKKTRIFQAQNKQDAESQAAQENYI